MCAHLKNSSLPFYMDRTEMRRKWHLEGKCANCGKVLDREGWFCKKCCDRHSNYTRDMYHFYQDNGICPRCGKNNLVGEERYCPECRAKDLLRKARYSDEKKRAIAEKSKPRKSAYNKRIYEDRKQNGMCVRCGKHKAEQGKMSCGMCLEKQRKQNAKRYDKKVGLSAYDRQILRERGMCSYCLKEIPTHGKLCDRCFEKISGNLEKATVARDTKNHYWVQDNRAIFFAK